MSSQSLPPWLNRLGVRRCIVFSWHIFGVIFCYVGAFLLRFDFNLSSAEWQSCLTYLPITVLTYLGTFIAFRLYAGIWTYFSFQESLKVFPALFTATGLQVGIILAIRPMTEMPFPRSVFVTTLLLLLSWEFGGRFIIRWLRQHSDKPEVVDHENRCLIIGSTEDVAQVLRGARIAIQEVGKVIGILNDDLRRRGLSIDGVNIIGSPEEAGKLAKSLDITKMLILPPYNSPRSMNEIVDACAEAGAVCAIQVIPSFQDLASGRVNISSIRDVEIEDMLDREPASFDRNILDSFIRGKAVVITGAGGSIGSEISRQVCEHGPSAVVLFESSEFALFEIERELRGRHSDIPIIAYAGDIRRPSDVRDALTMVPNASIVYHAAAYKHVHLMEKNIPSCFDNNVLGSVTLAEIAEAEGVKDLIVISSDKAVRPTSVMGASKRIAERCVLEASTPSMVRKAVRFGNVLGSSGSVIPLFKEQIQNGGPVTVTTPDTRRYFMTIPEAVELVLMASAVGCDRDVMVLEMGEPVKIVDLARRLIRLSGFVPEEDIPISFIGLRPGEKEYEELLTEDENVVKTEHDKIWVLAKDADAETLPPVNVDELEKLVRTRNRDGLLMLTMASIAEHRLEQLGAVTERSV